MGEQPRSVSALLDPTSTPQTNQKKLPQRRRYYRHCKSAPVAGTVPPEVIGRALLVRPPGFILQKVHPSFRLVALLLVIYLGVGTLCFYLAEHQVKGKKTSRVLDAVYFCVVTMTTLGYGDLVPNSVFTKLLACAFVFSGMALVGLVLSKAADYLVEKQEYLLVRALHMNQQVGETDILKEVESNKVKYKCVTILILLMVLIFSGTIFLVKVEKMSIVDAFYCVCCTITTLGFGDVSFSTLPGRAFAVFWILTSTLCLAQFFLYIAELTTERRRKSLVKLVLTRRLTNVDLEAADFNDDGNVDACEFIIYKLKEMGKITQEDISLVMKEFEKLDFDRTGTLSTIDVALAQSGGGNTNTNTVVEK